MTFSKKAFLVGLGSGIVLVLALLEMWGSYLDKSTEELAQPRLLRPLKPKDAPVPSAVYEGFPHPWFPKKLSTEADRWRLTPTAGDTVTLKHFKGQVLFINFWSTTCIPCIEEMPAIEKLYSSLEDARVEFLAVTMESRSEVNNFLTKRNFAVPVYLSDEQPPPQLAPAGFPTTYIVSDDGTVAFMHSGILNWDDDGTRTFLKSLGSETLKPAFDAD
jgi:thiol-disulfide isomerase/thioredoxin